LGLKERGLEGVELVVLDDHAGLRKAIAECLPDAAWQRSYVNVGFEPIAMPPRMEAQQRRGCKRTERRAFGNAPVEPMHFPLDKRHIISEIKDVTIANVDSI
jgi:hypothetical protein